jgi:phage shock protein A
MGIFQRLKRVTVGRVEAFLSRVEDPEVIFPQLIREMEQQLAEATETEATSAAALKRAERDLANSREKVDRLGNGAVLALKQGDEAMAREAVTAQIDAEKALERNEATLARAEDTLAKARAAREQIQGQLQEMRAKRDDIIARARVAKARKKIQETVQGSVGSSDSILDAVARMEASVEEDEAEIEIQAELKADSAFETPIEKRLKELGEQAEIQNRLDALKAEMSGGSGEPGGSGEAAEGGEG